MKKRGGFRYRWKQILTAIVFSFLCVVVIHISVKYLPDILQTTVVFEDEQLVSVLPEDELQLYQQMFPITLECDIERHYQCYGKLEKLCKNDGVIWKCNADI